MIYEWKCKTCGATANVTRSLDECGRAPDCGCECPRGESDWVKVFNSSTPYETLRDKGQFERIG